MGDKSSWDTKKYSSIDSILRAPNVNFLTPRRPPPQIQCCAGAVVRAV